MAVYKEKSAINAEALVSIFDAVDGHFAPTLAGSAQALSAVVENTFIDVRSNQAFSPSQTKLGRCEDMVFS